MKITNNDITLRIVDSTRFIGFSALTGGFFCLGRIVFVLVYGGQEQGEISGLSIGAVLLLAAGIAFSGKNDFKFDRNARKLVWRRSTLFSRQGGEVPFDEIEEAVVESQQVPTKSSGTATLCRLVLRTTQGSLPISKNFDGGAQKKCVETTARIREVLSHPPA